MMDIRKMAYLTMLMMIVPTVYFIGAEDHLDGLPLPQYHNALLQVNVTLPGPVPAVGYMVRVVNYYYRYDYNDPMVYTNFTGVAKFDLPPAYWGPVEVTVFDPVWRAVAKERTYLEPGRMHYLDLVGEGPLSNLSKVSGTVRKASDGGELSGIEVGLQGIDHLGNQFYKTTMTDLSGKYEIAFPNITGQISLYASSPSYMGPATSFASDPGTLVYTVDLDMVPTPSMPRDVKFRFTNSTSGEVITDGHMYYNGYYSHLDHSVTGMNSFSPDPEGWFDLEMGPGEFTTTFMSSDYDMNYSIRVETPIYVNGSDLSIEKDIDVPGLKYLEVNIWNSTSPLSWASVVSEEEAISDGTRTILRANAMTDASGRCFIGIRDDETTTLSFYHSGHQMKEVTVDPQTLPLKINVTLEEYPGGFFGETGTIKITPIDPVTGYRVPGTIRVFTEYSSNSYQTNQTGVFEGEVQTGFYTSIEVTTTLGMGQVNGINIVKGSNPDLVITIERVDPSELMIGRYGFYVVDASGDPVPNVPLVVNVERPYNYITILSGSDGKVEFYAGEGMVWVFTQDLSSFDRADWAIPNNMITTVDGIGGLLQNITVYPATPLDPIYGFVKDAVTGEGIQFADVSATSMKVFSGHEGTQPSGRSEDIELFYMSVDSNGEGFYRVWGRDEVFISASKDGYFPSYQRMTIDATRADTRNDILLYPIPELDLFINGTIVDGNGDPVQGYLIPHDSDHEGYYPGMYYSGTDGKFSIPIYKGNFSIEFGNMTLTDYYDLIVTGTVSDLILTLLPRSVLTLSLVNWSGEPAPGIEVQMEKKGGAVFVEYDTGVSSVEGRSVFRAPEGTYRLVVERSDLYDPWTSDAIELDGWNDEEMTVTLENRTNGDITGKVTGDGGTYFMGIPWTKVSLLDDSNSTVKEATTDITGAFSILDVLYGTYSIVAEPPENLSFVENVSSGYLPFGPEEITISSPSLVKDVELQYEMIGYIDYLNVTEARPTGTGAALNVPITIRFSKALDKSSVQGAISIDPAVGNMTVSYLDGDKMIRIDHNPFAPNTTYHVRILGSVLSTEGYPMWETMGYEWNFTTGTEMVVWEIFFSMIEVSDDKRVDVTVTAIEGIDIFIVIDDVGSFKLVEGVAGEYKVSIPGSNFEFDTDYIYHFSNVSGGEDLAPLFKGTIKVPERPWGITWSSVVRDDDMNWNVQAKGVPGSTIYIVIDGVGSFKLNEDTPGNFSVEIDGSEFEWGKSYDFHFSDRSDGPDLSPTDAGSLDMPEEEKGLTWAPYAIGCCFALVVLILLIVIVVIIMRKKKDTGIEE
jgi:hypothetical protein